jgi:hypothetical protein
MYSNSKFLPGDLAIGSKTPKRAIVTKPLCTEVAPRHRHRLQNWGVNPFLQPRELHRYAEAIYQHGAPLQNCFGFIDGTVREIARPKYNQRVMYNGHKRVHVSNFKAL